MPGLIEECLGAFDSQDVLVCEVVGVEFCVPKLLTSNTKAEGRFGKQDFVCLPDENVYRSAGPPASVSSASSRPHRRHP